jgi:hypothetical protein
MKFLYLIVFVSGLLLIAGSLLVPAARGIPIDRMLISHSEEWQLKFTTPDGRLAGLAEDAGKAWLLHFLRRVHNDPTTVAAWATASLSLVVLGFLGWRRELCFERRSEPDASPNGGLALGSGNSGAGGGPPSVS